MPLPHLSATSQTRLALQVLRSVDAQTVKLQHAHSVSRHLHVPLNLYCYSRTPCCHQQQAWGAGLRGSLLQGLTVSHSWHDNMAIGPLCHALQPACSCGVTHPVQRYDSGVVENVPGQVLEAF